MPASTLSVLQSPNFPMQLCAAIDLALDRVVFGICCHEEPLGSYNDHNSQLCNRLATVHNLEDGLDYCERHFRAVTR